MSAEEAMDRAGRLPCGLPVMTAGELQKVGAEADQETRLVEGMTDQVLLRGVVAAAETFGQPVTNTHLIAKLRRMDPNLRNTITKGAVS